MPLTKKKILSNIDASYGEGKRTITVTLEWDEPGGREVKAKGYLWVTDEERDQLLEWIRAGEWIK